MTIANLDIVVLIVTLAIFAQWVAWRWQWPAIVILSILGLVLGPVLGILTPDLEDKNFKVFLELCVALILFEGGLNLSRDEYKEVAKGVRRLVFPGILFSTIFAAIASHWIMDIEWPVALIFGAMICVTGPTVIMPLLRHNHLYRKPASYLKFEGIINDPIGSLLVVLIYQAVIKAATATNILWLSFDILLYSLISVILAFIGAWILKQSIIRGYIPEFLKPLVLLCFVFVLFYFSQVLQDQLGLMTVTIFGLMLANMNIPDMVGLRRFKEHITILLVSVVFILLTASLPPQLIFDLNWQHLALLLTLIFITRPLAIILSTIRADMSWQERGLVAWIAPRGIVAAAVAAIFGPALVAQGYSSAENLVPLVFALIIMTCVIHGFTLRPLSLKLNCASKDAYGVMIVGADSWTTELAQTLKNMDVPVLLVDSHWNKLKSARLAGIPVHYGQILSDASYAVLDLSQISSVIAATPNEAYNTLVCTHFMPEFSRHHVYQLRVDSLSDQHELSGSLKGRHLFDDKTLYHTLIARTHQKWRFHKTKFSESYSFENYLESETGTGITVLLVKKSGAVEWAVNNHSFKPQAGDTLISYMPS